MVKRWLTVIAAVALAGCSQDGSAGKTEVAVAEAAKPIDAAAVAGKLQAAGIPIKQLQILTAENDPNAMLGRPGGYSSKVLFRDGRHEGDQLADDSTIEVFADEAGAAKRKAYVESVTEGTPFLTQYMYQQGPVLVRLDRTITPAEAAKYEQALKSI